MKMTQNGHFWCFNDKFGEYVLLAHTCDDISMTSQAGSGYGWVTWMLTGMRTWWHSVGAGGQRGGRRCAVVGNRCDVMVTSW